MKELILIRHAKSDWGNEGLRDIDRHLNDRGYADAYAMSAWFAETHKKPDLLLCSTATRTLSTAMIFVRAMDLDIKKFKAEPRIYEAHRDELKKLLSEQDNSLSSIMLVGHNPSITELCSAFSADLYFDNLPTCAIVKITGNCKLGKSLPKGAGSLTFIAFRKTTITRIFNYEE